MRFAWFVAHRAELVLRLHELVVASCVGRIVLREAKIVRDSLSDESVLLWVIFLFFLDGNHRGVQWVCIVHLHFVGVDMEVIWLGA